MAELVAGELRLQIIRGTLREGDSLPPEADLVALFGISRPTLREAIRILESEQLLSIRRGSRGGATVHLPSTAVAARHAGLLLQVSGATIADVYAARIAIEPPATRMLAENLTDPQLRALEGALELERRSMHNPAEFAHTAVSFHRTVIELAGNKTLQLMWSMLHDIIDIHHSVVVADEAAKGPSDNLRGIKSHRHLVKLIQTASPAEAEAFWREHLVAAGQLLLKRHGGRRLLDVVGQSI